MTAQRRSLLLFLLFTYLCLFTESVYSARYLVLRVIGHVIPALLFGPWLVGLFRRRQGFVNSRLDLPMMAWLGTALVASLLGLSPRFSLERVWLYFGYSLGFYALLELEARDRGTSAFRALLMTGAVVCIVGLFEWVDWYLAWPFLPKPTAGWSMTAVRETLIPPVVHRLNAPLGGPIRLAAFLALLTPPTIGWMLTTENAQVRRVLGLFMTLALAVQVLTFSRGGVLALAVSLPLTGLGWVAAQRDWRKAFKKRLQGRVRTAYWIWSVLLVIAIALFGTFWFVNSFSGRQGSTNHRFTLWRVALDIVRAQPVVGVGPANFGRALLMQNDARLPRHHIQTAHNAYLNTAAEVGLLGLLVAGWAGWKGIAAFFARWRDASVRRRVRMSACAAALVGLAAQSLVDAFIAPAIWLPGLVLAAHILRQKQERVGATATRGHPAVPVATMIVLVISTAWLGWKDVGQVHFERSRRLLREADFEEASREAEKAAEIDPGLGLYAFQRAYAEGLWSITEKDSSLADQAIAQYRAALSADPVWGKHTANLAGLLRYQGNRTEALEWMERTVEADARPAYLVNLGVLHQELGTEAQAREAYAAALAQSPSWAGSGFWHADVDRSAAWAEIVQQAESRIKEKEDDGHAALMRFRTEMAWALGDDEKTEDLARTLMELHPGSASGYVWLARSLMTQQRATEALAAAEEAVAIAPTSSTALALRGCARWEAGRNPQAVGDLRVALFISPGNGDAHRCLGQVYEEQGDLDRAVTSYLHGLRNRVSQEVEVTLYQRLATFELLPGLVHIGLGRQAAAPQLRGARLLEEMGRCEDAEAVYRGLLAQDEYLEIARVRLDALPCYTVRSQQD